MAKAWPTNIATTACKKHEWGGGGLAVYMASYCTYAVLIIDLQTVFGVPLT